MSDNPTNAFLALLAGVAIGAGLGILFAPDSGRKTRQKIKQGVNEYSDELQQQLQELNRKVRSAVSEKNEQLHDSVDDLLAEAEDVAGRECPGLRVRTYAARGSVPEVLLSAAERASLLVMGAVDLGRLRTGSMGQNVHDVLTNAVTPTLIAREGRPQ